LRNVWYIKCSGVIYTDCYRQAKKSRLEARKEKCEIYCSREAVAAKGINQQVNNTQSLRPIDGNLRRVKSSKTSSLPGDFIAPVR